MPSTCDYKDQIWSRLCHIFFPPCARRGPSQVQGSHCGGSPGAGSGPTDGQPAPPRCRTPASSWTARATTRQSNPHVAERASRLLWPRSFWAETSRGRSGRLPTPGRRQRQSWFLWVTKSVVEQTFNRKPVRIYCYSFMRCISISVLRIRLKTKKNPSVLDFNKIRI